MGANIVSFDVNATGVKLPILWGLDTAWDSEENIIRGTRFIGAENMGLARVSFQPIDWCETPTLSDRQRANLITRLKHVAEINGVGGVKLALNNDATDKPEERYFNASANDGAGAKAYANLIYATTLECQERGWEVVSASPLNEPDYQWNNQGSKEDFLAIAKELKQMPQYKDGSIRISGGNTLNDDEALPWYQYLFDYIDEGNTHQLAGDFDHYADFFRQVRADGKYATADELHNVMEAMVGVEYGMQTGIWWGTAERARGEFCRASFGDRLAYSENRKAWSAASVYRAPSGKIQAFVGISERQGRPCAYHFVSATDVYFNGYGPTREFYQEMPADPNGAYQTELQRNAECVIDITWGEDVQPMVNGTYKIMNRFNKQVLSVDGAVQNLAKIYTRGDAGAVGQKWIVTPVPYDQGGDFSFHFIASKDAERQLLDVNNFGLTAGTEMIMYDGGRGSNEQWYLEYAGANDFRIVSKHSRMCLEPNDNGQVLQQEIDEKNTKQLWRFVAEDAKCEGYKPAVPAGLTATAKSASIALKWNAIADTDLDQYVIARSESGEEGTYNVVGRGFKNTEFVDNGVAPGKTYYYKVRAFDGALNASAYSEPVSVATLSDKALVAHWPFENSLEDASGNGLTAYVAEADAKNVDYNSKAVSDGSDEKRTGLQLTNIGYAQLPYNVMDMDEMTLAMWVFPTQRTANSTIFESSRDADNWMGLDINSERNLQFSMTVDGESIALTSENITAKQWNHVAVAMGKDKVTLYVNGQEADEAVAPGTARQLGAALTYIGQGRLTDNRTIRGIIGDVRVYNYPMDATDLSTEINGLMGIEDTCVSASPIVRTEYYNLLGQPVHEPAAGVYIIKEIHENGATTVRKAAL